MYPAFHLAKKYIRYRITAANGKGHGLHSPFVFHFVKSLLNDRKPYPEYDAVENLRASLLNNDSLIDVEDLGAGSALTKQKTRRISGVAGNALKPAKYGQLLYRIARYYKPETILELGTSLGLTTAYLALACPGSSVITFEGAPAVSDIAADHFKQLGIKNIQPVNGDFNDTLAPVLRDLKTVDLAFIDGNHRREPSLQYFNMLRERSNPSSILIFDDIHWSAEMEEAWEIIKAHPSVTLSIDLFFLGLVFFRTDFLVKQHFTIRF